MKNLLIGSVAASVAMFLWGFVFWALLAEVDTMSPDAELALQGALSEHVPETGTYVIPQMGTDDAEYTLRHETGPTAMLFVRKEGSAPMSPATYVYGLLHGFAVALLIGFLLRMAWTALPSYGARVRLVALAGLAAAIYSDVAAPIWWLHPWGYHLQNIVYSVVAWTIIGAIMARFSAPTDLHYAPESVERATA